MLKYLILIPFFFQNPTYAKNPVEDDSSNAISGVKIIAHASELSIVDQEVAKAIFRRLPAKRANADLVHGLIFKNDKHIFCVREPDRIYHCHFYIKNLGEGELSSYWSDHDYGKGSLMEYLKLEPQKGVAKLEVVDNRLHLYTEGKIAKYLYERLDLAKVSYHQREDGIRYEKRIGRKMKCIRAEAEKQDIHACRVFIPMGPEKKPVLKPKENA